VILRFVVLGGALLISACSMREEKPVSSASARRVIVVEGTQAHVDSALSIAAGNIGEDEQGIAAILWISTSPSAPPLVVKAHRGRRVEIPGHVLEVVDIARGERGSVELDVSTR
jgi:hypothetical protein